MPSVGDCYSKLKAYRSKRKLGCCFSVLLRKIADALVVLTYRNSTFSSGSTHIFVLMRRHAEEQRAECDVVCTDGCRFLLVKDAWVLPVFECV